VLPVPELSLVRTIVQVSISENVPTMSAQFSDGEDSKFDITLKVASQSIIFLSKYRDGALSTLL
jgi:hypothetical protein